MEVRSGDHGADSALRIANGCDRPDVELLEVWAVRVVVFDLGEAQPLKVVPESFVTSGSVLCWRSGAYTSRLPAPTQGVVGRSFTSMA
jgi:hypothetical protein